MKRRILLIITAVLALLATLTVITVCAAGEDYSWATLEYAYVPLEDGGAVETGRLQDAMYLERAVDITFNPDVVEFKLDGTVIETSPVHLEEAGRYRISLTNKATAAKYDYNVSLKPVINITEGQVFTSYPTLLCSNATKFCLDEGKATWNDSIVSGDVINSIGQHELRVYGHNGQIFVINFYVKVCTAERVFDANSGKEALKLTVGSFEDIPDLAVYLDGSTTALPTGESFVTGVGQHSISATINGATVSNLHALPSQAELRIQLDLIIPSGPSKTPFYFQFSQWDAEFWVDGKPVKGDYRVAKHGEHVIVAKDANGNVIENAFLVRASEAHEPIATTEMHVEFDNPHNVYVIFVIIPAIALIAVAGWFFLQRRRIV